MAGGVGGGVGGEGATGGVGGGGGWSQRVIQSAQVAKQCSAALHQLTPLSEQPHSGSAHGVEQPPLEEAGGGGEAATGEGGGGEAAMGEGGGEATTGEGGGGEAAMGEGGGGEAATADGGGGEETEDRQSVIQLRLHVA